MTNDHYDLLGVPPNADRRTIQRAFRKKAAASHPDRGGSNEMMFRLNEAWRILSDPDLRRSYDASRTTSYKDRQEQTTRQDRRREEHDASEATRRKRQAQDRSSERQQQERDQSYRTPEGYDDLSRASSWVRLKQAFVDLYRTHTRPVWLIVVAALFNLALIPFLLSPAEREHTLHEDWNRFNEKRFDLIRVVDGNTLEILVHDADPAATTTLVRLWGIKTNDTANQFIENATLDGYAKLYLQAHRLYDQEDRLLAYIHLRDGEDLNGLLIKNGLAEHDDRWPHGRADAYKAYEQQYLEKLLEQENSFSEQTQSTP